MPVFGWESSAMGEVHTNERGGVRFPYGTPDCPGWTLAAPLPPLDESGEEDE
jgi:hypothetical protein